MLIVCLHIELLDVRMNILKLKKKMNGSKSRDEVGEEDEYPTIWTYLWSVMDPLGLLMDLQSHIGSISITALVIYIIN